MRDRVYLHPTVAVKRGSDQTLTAQAEAEAKLVHASHPRSDEPAFLAEEG